VVLRLRLQLQWVLLVLAVRVAEAVVVALVQGDLEQLAALVVYWFITKEA
jgi:hypothetical protein